MQSLSEKILVKVNSAITLQQSNLYERMQTLKSTANRSNLAGITEFRCALLDVTNHHYRLVWDIIIQTSEQYLKNDIFLILSSDESEVTREICKLSERPRHHSKLCFEQFCGKKDLTVALDEVLDFIDQQFEMTCFQNNRTLFDIARGLE